MSQKYPNIAIFLSTDEYPSPFDIQLLYDTGIDHVIYYGKVTQDNCKQLILDAMFPRDPEGILHTIFWIGGTDADSVIKIAEIAKKTMFKPFIISTIVDPQGGYTTAAGLVAKVAECLRKSYNIHYKEARYAIIGGAGRVGSNAAYLLAKDGANVKIIDILTDLAVKKAGEINEKIGAERVKALETYPKNDEEYIKVLSDADVIITTGPPSVQLISKSILEKLENCKVVADVNATPPTGIEGIKLGKDCKEFIGKIYSIGPLAIGTFKKEVQKSVIKAALEAPPEERGMFELDELYAIAKKIIGL